MSIHTQHTLALLRKNGYQCDVAERFLAYAGKFGQRKDLFGFIDIIAYSLERGEIIGVQSCSTKFQEHMTTILGNEFAREWVQLPNAFIELYGWRKLKVKRGGKAVRWTPRIYRFTKNDFQK